MEDLIQLSRLHKTNLDYSSLSHSLAISTSRQPCQKLLTNRAKVNKFSVVTPILIIGLVVSALIPLVGTVLAKFTIITEIDNVNSFTGKYKITYYLDGNKVSTSKQDLGKLANYYDDSEIQISKSFKTSPHTFKVCLDGDLLDQCIKGINSPAKRPETVKFTLPHSTILEQIRLYNHQYMVIGMNKLIHEHMEQLVDKLLENDNEVSMTTYFKVDGKVYTRKE